MRVQYFDNWEFKHLLSLVEVDPYEAIKQFEDYLKYYSKDYSAFTYYVYALIIVGRFDEAWDVLKFVEEEYSKDVVFCRDKKKVNRFKDNIIFDTLKLLAYQKRYKELYQYCTINRSKLILFGLESLDCYCCVKLGMQNISSRDECSYRFRQIMEYKESDFLDHIKKHLADYNQDLDKPNSSIFVPEFPLEKILNEVKNFVPSDKKLFNGFFDNTYVFKYDGCGRVDNKLVNYFKVVTFHDTADFITMYPVNDCQNLPYVDLNYLNCSQVDSKVKKLSQIDKFKKRYNR